MKFETEQMNESFVKHHIRGLAVDAVIHRFSAADTGEYAHDHPFRFTSFIISGGYREKIFSIGRYGR